MRGLLRIFMIYDYDYDYGYVVLIIQELEFWFPRCHYSKLMNLYIFKSLLIQLEEFHPKSFMHFGCMLCNIITNFILVVLLLAQAIGG